jgi:hypothetical protein
MTNAIIMSNLFPVAFLQQTDKEAKRLVLRAKNSIEFAEQELNFGNAASSSNIDGKNEQLSVIAVWHYEKSLRNFRDAIANLEQAKTYCLSAKHRKYVETKIDECYRNSKFLFADKQESEVLLNN